MNTRNTKHNETEYATKNDLDNMLSKEYSKLTKNIIGKSFNLKNPIDDDFAQEIISETYLKILKKIEEQKLLKNTLENYFGLSTYNLLIDKLKNKSKQMYMSEELSYSNTLSQKYFMDDSKELINEHADQLRKINDILNWSKDLTEEERVILFERSINGVKSYQKLAKMYGYNYRKLIKVGHNLDSKIKKEFGNETE